jgi:hypothetical protein
VDADHGIFLFWFIELVPSAQRETKACKYICDFAWETWRLVLLLLAYCACARIPKQLLQVEWSKRA